ncbi:MAG TPA: ribosomal protein S18-alanine N-acetyltransferase [Candidatus Faecousia excrementigallinarum]|uniref:[Ribosomal protein bS18]-alanine N-acetyltransferase n=1 Tax=Candidatus Faecousia excrementigallinarum TaxID=2840806 RepID=A0A9D0Z3E9_9FIRM|nr:ribosomal protein S18-alanine N-acetyltransferase [Candidatus Faecousia excrementigallinarum]
MRIVKMQSEHVASVAEMERQCFSDPWSEKSVASELHNPLSLWLIAEVDGVVAGYVGSQTVLDSADMMNLAVSPSFRRQGIGERLVNCLTEALKEKGVKTLLLEVRISNEPAKELYQKLGFEMVGKRPRYYEKPREDALILRKEL